MDGTLAALFLIVGLTDMGISHCGHGGCLARDSMQGRFDLSVGDVMYQENNISEEVYLRYSLPKRFGPFQPIAGASVTSDGDAWVGFGAAYTASFLDDRAYVQLSLMPGLHAQGSGPDLGHPLEFRSGVELGYETPKGIRYGISYDHRSNAEISSVNPGMETLQFRVSFPLR